MLLKFGWKRSAPSWCIRSSLETYFSICLYMSTYSKFYWHLLWVIIHTWLMSHGWWQFWFKTSLLAERWSMFWLMQAFQSSFTLPMSHHYVEKIVHLQATFYSEHTNFTARKGVVTSSLIIFVWKFAMRRLPHCQFPSILFLQTGLAMQRSILDLAVAAESRSVCLIRVRLFCASVARACVILSHIIFLDSNIYPTIHHPWCLDGLVKFQPSFSSYVIHHIILAF